MVAADLVHSQGLYSIQYAMNFPLGNTADFIGKTSFRGATADFRYLLKPNMSAGLSTGWYTFYEAENYTTYTQDRLSVSGKQYHYINSVPILVTFDYYARPDEAVNPFAGVGIGTTSTRWTTDIGLYRVETINWPFTLAPEAGVRYKLRPGVEGLISLRYMHCFESSDLDNHSYLSLNVGLMWGTGVH